MGTPASVHITDPAAGTHAWITVGADGHHLGRVLIDVAEHWKNKINDDDPLPPPGTPDEFADTACNEHWGRAHNGHVTETDPGKAEYHYLVTLNDGVVDTITASHRTWDTDTLINDLRAGREPVPNGHAHRWTIELAAVPVAAA